MMFWRRCTSPPTTLAPAVVANPCSSSSGSVLIQGRSGRATLTRKARSRWTVSSSRVLSRVTLGAGTSFSGSIVSSGKSQRQANTCWPRLLELYQHLQASGLVASSGVLGTRPLSCPVVGSCRRGGELHLVSDCAKVRRNQRGHGRKHHGRGPAGQAVPTSRPPADRGRQRPPRHDP